MLLEPELRAQLERLALRSRRRVRGMWSGRHASVQRGESLDFADYRQYTPGDDFRRIDHNLRARLGVVLVRLFEAEDELPLHLVCDVSASMGHRTKLRTAQVLAGAIAYMALSGGDRVYPAATPGRHTALDAAQPARHLGGWPRLEAWLESLSPSGPTNLAAAFQAARHRGVARGPFVVISDLLSEGWGPALDLLGAAGTGGLVLHVLAPDELEPDLSGDLRLVDAETGATIDVSTSETTMAAYRDAVAAFVRDAAARSRRNGMDYVLVPARPGAVSETILALAAAEVVG